MMDDIARLINQLKLQRTEPATRTIKRCVACGTFTKHFGDQCEECALRSIKME